MVEVHAWAGDPACLIVKTLKISVHISSIFMTCANIVVIIFMFCK